MANIIIYPTGERFLRSAFFTPYPNLNLKVKKKKLGNFNEKPLILLTFLVSFAFFLVSFISLVSFYLETFIYKNKKRVKKSQKQ